MATTIYNPKMEFYGAMREVLAAIRTAGSTCPFCHCAYAAMHDADCPLDRLRVVEEHYLSQLADEPLEPRRECTLMIDRDRLRMLLTMGGRMTMYCDNLPEDAEIVGVDTSDRFEDVTMNYPIRLVIASESFAPVLPHERPSLPGPTGYIAPAPMAKLCEAFDTLAAPHRS